MGHFVTALLGERSTLTAFATKEDVRQPVAAKANFWLLPLTEDAVDKVAGIPVGEPIEGFACLFPKFVEKLKQASTQGWLVYVETEYFGGKGAQGAVAFRDGAILYGPEKTEWGSINQALACVGVKIVQPAQDEFETVGLDLHRATEDWLPEGEDRDT